MEQESSVQTGTTKKSLFNKHAMRQLVSQKRIRFQNGEFDLDLSYICPNILAMGLPASGMDAMFRNKEGDVAAMLNKFHPGSYMIYNLAQKKYDYTLFENRVQDLGWKDHHAPGLELLFQNVNSMCEFLKQDLKNVVVVHCKAGKGRTGTSIAAMLVYCGLYRTPEEALKYFSYRRANDISPKAGVTIPSQKRYIKYFGNILSGAQQPNRNRYKITSINVSGVPMYDKKNGTKLCVHVMQDTVTEIYNGKKEAIKLEPVVSTAGTFCSPDLKNTELDGDVMLKFCHLGFFNEEVKFRISFNTRMIVGDEIYWSFFKHDLDDAYKDDDVPSQFKLEIRMTKCGESAPPPHGVLSEWEKALRNRHLYQNLFTKMSYQASTVYDPANNTGDTIDPSQMPNFLSQPQQVINGIIIEDSTNRSSYASIESWEQEQEDLFAQEQARIATSGFTSYNQSPSSALSPRASGGFTAIQHSQSFTHGGQPPALPRRPKPSMQQWEQYFAQHITVSQQPASILVTMLQPVTVQPQYSQYQSYQSSTSPQPQPGYASYNNNYNTTPTNTNFSSYNNSFHTNNNYSPSPAIPPVPQVPPSQPYNAASYAQQTPSGTYGAYYGTVNSPSSPNPINSSTTSYDIPMSHNGSLPPPPVPPTPQPYQSFYGNNSTYQQQYQQVQQFNTAAPPGGIPKRPAMQPPTYPHQ